LDTGSVIVETDYANRGYSVNYGSYSNINQNYGSILIHNPSAAEPYNKKNGAIASTTGAAAWNPAGVTYTGSYPAYYDSNSRWIPMVAIAATPASATAVCNRGTIAFDNNYIYSCITDNNWKRAAVGSW